MLDKPFIVFQYFFWPTMLSSQIELSFWENLAFTGPWDFVVVGAGVTGLHAAIEIKRQQPRFKVLILEARALGTVASTRNAGFLCLGSPSELQADLEKLGESDLIELISAKWSGIQRTLNLLGGNAVGLRNVRGYEVFAKEYSRYSQAVSSHDSVVQDLPKLNQILAEASTKPIPYMSNRRRKGAMMQKPLPAPYFGDWKAFQGGLSAPSNPWGPEAAGLLPMAWEGQVNPFLLRESLLRYARNLGIRIQEGLQVVQSDAQNLTVRSDLSNKDDINNESSNILNIKAKNIIIATNALTKNLFHDQIAPIIPQRGQMWHSAALRPVDLERLNGNYHADRGYIYYRTYQDRLLLGGGRNQDFNLEQTTEWSENQLISDYLKSYSVDVLGLSPDLEWEFRWSGTMGFTESGLPQCKDLQNGKWLVAGMNGMGMALGPEMGRRVACMALKAC